MELFNFLKCSQCQLEFDNEFRSCKLLSCSCSICLTCVKEMCCKDQNFSYECVKCKRKQSFYDNDNQLVTSKIVSYLIVNRTNIILKDFSCILRLALKEKKRQFLKENEDLVKKIDHHSQQLIELVNQNRDRLHSQIKSHRQANLFYNEETIKNSQNEHVTRIKKLEEELRYLINKNEEKDMKTTIRLKSHQLQWLIYELKNNQSYFTQSQASPFVASLGRLLNLSTSPLDQTYFKIKHLKRLLADSSQYVKVNLAQPNGEIINKRKVFRQDILPLTLKRIVCVNFNSDHSLSLELYDGETGVHLKTVHAHERITYFPISCAYGNYFCVSFTADKDSKNDQCCNPLGQGAHDDNDRNYIHLYDSSLNLIASVRRNSCIESVYMNSTNVCVAYSHPLNACCHVYDYEMRLVSEFGQRTNPQAPFFLEKCTTITTRQEASLRFRQDPQIFGLTKECVYLWTWHKCYVMCRRTGVVVHSIDLRGNRTSFLLDEDSTNQKTNIIKVNREARKVIVYEEEKLNKNTGEEEEEEILIENTFDDNLDAMHLVKVVSASHTTNDQRLAFVNPDARTVVFI